MGAIFDVTGGNAMERRFVALSRRQAMLGAAGLAVLPAMPAIVARAAADDDWQAGAGAEWTKVLAAAKREGSVVVGAPGLAGAAMTAPFARDTGLTLELLAGPPNAHSSRVQAELQANNVTIDVILGGLAEFAVYDRLRPLDSELMLPNVTDGKYWRDGRIKWVDNERRKLVQATEYVGGWPIINTAAVKDGEIASWKDILSEKYRERSAASIRSFPDRARPWGRGSSSFTASIS